MEELSPLGTAAGDQRRHPRVPEVALDEHVLATEPSTLKVQAEFKLRICC